ncbi:hypothetical protein A0H81_11766 [Grifola frondosa]|uniref:F-box domain-containing protein n=1 Tax=Grifola frondosa TaxID=5627 RepID=A0A1C7LUX3_GRIFR|nr:hypothetical protein A0H81_11766 [Grifola frondosa]
MHLLVPRFPAELTDEIIDHLHDDQRALSSCSLTCRGWVTRARYNRFKSVEIYVKNWSGFKQLLDDYPPIGDLVCSLSLVGNAKHGYLSRSDPEAVRKMMRWANEGIPAILPLLSRVTDLALLRIDLSGGIVEALINHLRSVETLRLTSCGAKDVSVLLTIIGPFPELQSVRVKSWSLLDRTNLLPPHPSPLASSLHGALTTRLPSIKKFSMACRPVKDTTALAILQWLVDQSLYHSLSSLAIPLQGGGEVATLDRVLKVVGPGLRKLEIGLEPDYLGAEDLTNPPLTLAHCTNLHTLKLQSIKLHRNIHLGSLSSHLAWVPRLLSQVSSPHIQYLTFRIRAAGAERADLEALDWTTVDEILASPPFQNLRGVTFHIMKGDAIINDVVPFIKGCLPNLEARRITRFIRYAT